MKWIVLSPIIVSETVFIIIIIITIIIIMEYWLLFFPYNVLGGLIFSESSAQDRGILSGHTISQCFLHCVMHKKLSLKGGWKGVCKSTDPGFLGAKSVDPPFICSNLDTQYLKTFGQKVSLQQRVHVDVWFLCLFFILLFVGRYVAA